MQLWKLHDSNNHKKRLWLKIKVNRINESQIPTFLNSRENYMAKILILSEYIYSDIVILYIHDSHISHDLQDNKLTNHKKWERIRKTIPKC